MTEFFNVTLALPAQAPVRPKPEQVEALQNRLAELPQVETTLHHLFAPGMYVRRLEIPAGSVVVGKKHRHSHPVMLTKGTATINTDRGMETIHAPHVWVSEPGAKRALVTHTDCEFVTVHLNENDTTDLDALEADIIIPEPHLSLPDALKHMEVLA